MIKAARWGRMLGVAAFLAGDLASALANTAERTAPIRPGATTKSAPAPAKASPPPATKAPAAKAPAPATAKAAAPRSTAVTAPATASRRIGTVDYMSVAEVARRLGLSLTAGRSSRVVILSGRGVKAELEADQRDSTINGLRVFLGSPVALLGGALYVSRVDFERCLTPLLRPGLGMAARAKPKVIVLDPGHGGRDFGKVPGGAGGSEKTYTLDVARRAEKLLTAAGYKVVLTRETDTFIDLAPRAVIANTNRADLFVSIHFNALVNDTRTSGVEIFTFAPRYQRSTISWGPRQIDDTENRAAPVNRYDHWSVLLAQSLQRRFVTDLKTADRGRKIAHFGVLRGLNCPGLLLECGFLTSEAELRKIATPAYRQQLAEAIADGISDYAVALGSAKK